MNDLATKQHTPWNKGKLTGQKAPLRLCDIWAIRVRLQLAHESRDLALFNLAIDSKLRACEWGQVAILFALALVIPAQAGIQLTLGLGRTGSRPAPGRRAGGHFAERTVVGQLV